MNIQTDIPLASTLAYLVLIAVVLVWGRTRTTRWYAVVLASAALWSGCSFLIRAAVAPEYDQLWGKILFSCAVAVTVLYYRFVRSFQNRKADWITGVGYLFLSGVAVLAATGLFPRSITSRDGLLIMDRGPFLYPVFTVGFVFLGLSIASLVRQHRRLGDPLARTRTLYLLIGLCAIPIFSLLDLDDHLADFSVDHIGNLLNAFIATYAILRLNLLEIRFVVRRALAVAVVTFLFTALYVGMLALVELALRADSFVGQAEATGITVLVGILFFSRANLAIHARIDRWFLGESYAPRQQLMRLPDQMRQTVDAGELAKSLLGLVISSVGAKHTALLTPQDDGFATEFAIPGQDGQPVAKLSLSGDSPILSYLAREKIPLLIGAVDTVPELMAMWRSERRGLDAVGYEVLCPLVAGDKLVGILAIGPNDRATAYTGDEVTLLARAASEVGVIMENARRHSAIQTEANTDGLTGLFNHRLFYQALEDQIRRSSRFGTAFSLIMMDVDLFKPYNDTYGHLAGDAVLRQIAEAISAATRRIDMAFRYGGEEFAILLPESKGEESFKVAERIRRTIDARMNASETWLTVSAGIACWPNDAVLAGELVQCADSALYQAKRSGRNCTCLFSRLPAGVGMTVVPGRVENDLSLVYALAATVDAKDHYTYGHSNKVSKRSVAIGTALGLDAAHISLLRDAGLLHDIGKISVPDTVLRKEGRLSHPEWVQMRGHPDVAVAILRHVDRLALCLPAIRHHHERFDGSGYPLGLQGRNIPLDARIVAVADAYDAMTSSRPYRAALPPERALDELLLCAGRQFDPDIVQAFAGIIEPSSERERQMVAEMVLL